MTKKEKAMSVAALIAIQKETPIFVLYKGNVQAIGQIYNNTFFRKWQKVGGPQGENEAKGAFRPLFCCLKTLKVVSILLLLTPRRGAAWTTVRLLPVIFFPSLSFAPIQVFLINGVFGKKFP